MRPLKRVVCLLLFLLFLLQGKGEAAHLHVLMVCDTNDSEIGQTIQVDIAQIAKQLEAIRKNTGLDLDVRLFAGADARFHRVIHAINSLEVAEDDVILFYFAGHGFRTKNKKDILPYLFLGTTFQCCDFYMLTQRLFKKEPRLLIALSDCCNNIISEMCAPKIVQNRFSSCWWDYSEGNYRKLFLEAEGVFIGTGCAQGEYSLCCQDLGGFFTHAFCEALEEVVDQDADPLWDHVIERLAEKVLELSGNEQHPYCFFIQERPSKDLMLDSCI